MKRLIVISNALPVKITPTDDPLKFTYTQSSGGLVTGLVSLSKTRSFLWLGTISDIYTQKQRSIISRDLKERDVLPVFVPPELYKEAYNGFCNQILWPNINFYCDRNVYNPSLEQSYIAFNQLFIDKLQSVLRDNDIVWVHDYHFFMLLYMIREQIKTRHIKLGFFLHTPFPDYDIIKNLPYLKKIILGLVSSDHIGVHCFEYKNNIIQCIRNLEFTTEEQEIIMRRYDYTNNYKILPEDRKIKLRLVDNKYEILGRSLSIKTIPIGINKSIFEQQLEQKTTKDKVEIIREKFKDKFIVLGVDRVDYIKGIPNRLVALKKIYKEQKYNNLSKKMVFIQIGVPSRVGVVDYQNLTQDINLKVAQINSKNYTHFETGDNLKTGGNIKAGDIKIEALENNIYYLNESIEFQELCALYKASDLCLVTSLRDGMNLVCMEYAVCQGELGEGTMIISETTGAVSSLPGSLITNAYCADDIADKIFKAYLMDKEERRERNKVNYQNVAKFDAELWAERSIKEIDSE